MSIETLLEAVRRRAEERIEEIRARARAEAEEVRAGALREADERRGEHRKRVERDARAEGRARLAGLRRDARRRVLDARSRGLDRIVEVARGRLAEAMASEAYRISLPAVLAAARRPLAGRNPEIRCAPDLGPVLEEVLAEDDADTRPAVEEDAEVEAGFRIVSEDERLVVDASLEAALGRLLPRISIEVVRRVEGRPGLPAVSARPGAPEGGGSAGSGDGDRRDDAEGSRP